MFVKFENILWNKDWIASKTFDQFYEQEKHHGLSEEKMREIYDACTGGKKSEIPEKPQDNDFGSNGFSDLNG